ncbi:hypothetical protein [Kitasatospora purpeofusca]|uniref:hypothetical protein n=1 Tax=Kitasatospora purpeofusca TaxID=67352 RepID=UPI0038680DF8|nr:hypothetical protein OIP63_35770 [Kitasatospora purpeofusca]
MSAHDHVPPAAGPAQASAPDRSAVPGPGALPEGPARPPGAPVPAALPAGTPDSPNAPDVPDAPDTPGAPGRKLPRAVGVALATVGLLAVTAVSATVTVAVGKPDHRPAAVAATAPATAATTTAGTASSAPTGTATASAAPTTAPPAAPAPAPVPTPTSTLKGTVSNGRHDGDLQYFLLPIPQGGESYGPADGMLLTDKDMGDQMGGGADVMKTLKSLGYKDSATRTYRTADGKAEVTVTLVRFSTAARATDFARNYTLDGLDPVEITGDPTAHGYVDKPKQQAYTGSLSGISSQGDVQYIIDVDVKGTPDKALLSELMKRQRDWLTSGR